MAQKKPKTPTPPRVQAPQRRESGGGSAFSDLAAGPRLLLYGVAAAGVVALVVVVLVIALGGGSSGDKKVASAMTAAGCTFKTVKAYVPPGGNIHVNSKTAKLPWNTTPPSNGQHYPLWAVWGFYTQAVNPRMVVHNEEHGGVILWWGSQVPQSTVSALHDLYSQQAQGVVGTPYPSLGSKLAITAWTGDPSKYGRNGYYGFGHIGICSSWTPKVEKAFVAFRSTYRGHGPEGVPLSSDAPGTGPTTQ